MLAVAMRLLSVVLASGPATPNVYVEERGEECPGLGLEARVADYLAGGPGADSPVEATGTLRREDDEWVLDLFVNGRLVRSFHDARCEDVVDAAALVIAIKVDPEAELRRTPPFPGEDVAAERAPPSESAEPRRAAQPEPPTPPGVLRTTAPADSRIEPRRRWTVPVPIAALGVDGGIDGGGLPSVGAFVRPSVGVLLGRLALDATAAYRTRTRAASAIEPSAGGFIGAWAVGLRACGRLVLSIRALKLPLCGGVEAGQILAEGFGFPGRRSTRLAWLAITAGAGALWVPRPWIALGARVELGVAPLRGDLIIEGLETVHRIGVVFGRGMLTAQARIGRGM